MYVFKAVSVFPFGCLTINFQRSTPHSVDSTNHTTKPSTSSLSVHHLHGVALARYKLLLKLRSPRLKNFGPSAFQLNRKQMVKRGSRVRLTEAITMDFIARNTAIPVPRVINVFGIRGSIHIVQEYIDAPVLADVWSQMCSDEQKSCLRQLQEYLEQLRALTPPEPGRVQAVDGTGCLDDRLHPGEWGPFDSIDTFNAFFYHDIVRQRPADYPEAQDPLAKVQGRKWRTVFSHGDLGPHNILWKDGRIVAIIDWECAGWFPEYWEYTRSYFGPRLLGWWEMYQEFTVQYPDELEVELKLAAYFVRI